jgi:hypothetical protein
MEQGARSTELGIAGQALPLAGVDRFGRRERPPYKI